MALRGAFLQPLLRGKHLEESKEVVNNSTGHVLKRCILVFNYQMKASFISLNSVRLTGQWEYWLLSFVPILCSWTRIQAINRKKWMCRATMPRIFSIFPLNLFLTKPGLLLVRRTTSSTCIRPTVYVDLSKLLAWFSAVSNICTSDCYTPLIHISSGDAQE